MSELNVITACFPCGEKSAVTEKRWQWSYGQILKFQGIPDLPDVFNVHFSGQPSAGTAKSWPAQNAQVEIPNEYLETGGPVYAWIFLHEGEEDGETVYDITIPVKRRPQPTDEPITPTQQSAIDTAIAILQSSAATASEQAEIATEAAETATSAVDAVTEAAREAAQSALSASNAATNAQTAQRAAAQSAMDAETARRTAGDFAEAANASAIRAEDSANDATESAARAATADENAQAAKTAAEASASAAAQSATQASGSASQAALSASNAASSATSAQTSATNAEQSKTDAETAQGKAEDAQTAAETAETNAAGSATQAAASAASVAASAAQIATNTTDITNLKSQIDAITGNKTIKAESKTDTGTAASMWNTNTGISPDLMDDAYVVVTEVANATASNGYINISIAYSDGSASTNNFVTELNEWQKINFNPEKTISAVYVQYLRANSALGSAVTSKWSYGIVYGEPITYLRDQVAYNRNNIDALAKKTALNQTWVLGSWYESGYSPIPRYRVCLQQITTLTVPFVIDIISGYRYFVFKYDENGNIISQSGWLTSTYTVKAGDRIAITISRNPEDTSIIADINEHLEAISFYSGANEDTPTPSATGLPAYAKAGADGCMTKLLSKIQTATVAVCGFNTDQHIINRDDDNPVIIGERALAYMTQNFPFNAAILGGDAAGYSSKTIPTVLNDAIGTTAPLSDANCKVVSMPGNHDAKNAEESSQYITGSALFNVNMRTPASFDWIKIRSNNQCNAYYDDDSVGIRFIFIQTTDCQGYTINDAALYTWLGDLLDNMPSGFKAVLFGHHALTSEYNGTVFVEGRAFQSVLNPRANNIICVICGHNHRDVSIVSTSGILYIGTTCAWNQMQDAGSGASYTAEDGTVRTNGTITETAFDTFVINPATKDIYAIRYGAGSDRTWMAANRTPGTNGLTV